MAGCWFRIACLVGLLSSAQASSAQEVPPLHTFFQQNFDSTVIYQSGLSVGNGPYYLILAKQKDQVYFFTYTSPYQSAAGRYFPGNLMLHFANEEAAFRAAVPDKNRFLLPGLVPSDTLRRYWRRLRTHRFWTVKDDQQTAFPPLCAIDDGDHNTFFLIDRRTIRAASFYAPAYREACAGQDPGRQQAINALNVFTTVRRSNQANAR